jgi:hypothetical protein
MVATLAGSGALVLGLALLLLPLLATELSRPGDSAWGALVLVLALVLVTSADRLTGSPMLAVICGALLVGRLLWEVAQGRWRLLSPEERHRLGSWERWSTSLSQAGAASGQLASAAGQNATVVLRWWQERRQPKASGKRWVRPDAEAGPAPEPVEVSDFGEIDALLQAAPPAEDAAPPASSPPAGGEGSDAGGAG